MEFTIKWTIPYDLDNSEPDEKFRVNCEIEPPDREVGFDGGLECSWEILTGKFAGKEDNLPKAIFEDIQEDMENFAYERLQAESEEMEEMKGRKFYYSHY